MLLFVVYYFTLPTDSCVRLNFFTLGILEGGLTWAFDVSQLVLFFHQVASGPSHCSVCVCVVCVLTGRAQFNSVCSSGFRSASQDYCSYFGESATCRQTQGMWPIHSCSELKCKAMNKHQVEGSTMYIWVKQPLHILHIRTVFI